MHNWESKFSYFYICILTEWVIYLIDDIRLFLSISCSLLFTTNLIKKSMNVEEQQVFIIKWLLSQSDLFLNRVKGRVSFLWRCKPSPFEPYWLSTWVVHWIHRDRRKTCTHTANFHYTPRHFIYSLAQLMSLSKVPLKCQSKLAFFTLRME